MTCVRFLSCNHSQASSYKNMISEYFINHDLNKDKCLDVIQKKIFYAKIKFKLVLFTFRGK